MSAVLTFEQTIQAPIDQVYRAFTNATALREWLCDTATVDARPGGRVYLAWISNYYRRGRLHPARTQRTRSLHLGRS